MLLSKFMPHHELGHKHLTFSGPYFPWFLLYPLVNAEEEARKGQEVSRTSYGHAVGGQVQAPPTAPWTCDPGQVHWSLDQVLP